MELQPAKKFFNLFSFDAHFQMLTDTHCHLFYSDLKKNIEGVIKRANDLGVTRFICVGTNLEDSAECLDLAKRFDSVFSTAGIHPHDAKDAPENYIEKLFELLANTKMAAVGEIGLDYFRNISEPEIQRTVFREQLELSASLNMPIVFHNREADEDTVRMLEKHGPGKGIAHCFSSTIETAERFMELGYHISFSGNLTFKNSHLPEVAKEIPLNRVLVETDSPYMSPEPFRGKPNEPGRTRYVAEKLADIHAVSLETIAEITSANAATLFGY